MYLLLISVRSAVGNSLVTKRRCPLYIATLATNEYLAQSEFLRHKIAEVSGQKCDLEIVATNSTFQELTVFKSDKVRHKNSFAGIDVKIRAILSVLKRIPQNSLFLWLDSSLVVLNKYNFLLIKLSMKRREILFAREGSGKKMGANIGVIVMKNTPRVTQLFNTTLNFVEQGHWDQGVICCLLGLRTGYNCENIKTQRTLLKWSYLSNRFVAVKKVGPFSCDFSKKFKGISKRNLPVFLKLIGDSKKRARCLEILRKPQHYDLGTS